MWPSLEKVVEEARALDERIDKLDKFILPGTGFGQLPGRERHWLKEQRRVMRHYSSILHDRIEAFKEAEAQEPVRPLADP